jgi:hypothetical protein
MEDVGMGEASKRVVVLVPLCLGMSSVGNRRKARGNNSLGHSFHSFFSSTGKDAANSSTQNDGNKSKHAKR